MNPILRTKHIKDDSGLRPWTIYRNLKKHKFEMYRYKLLRKLETPVIRTINAVSLLIHGMTWSARVLSQKKSMRHYINNKVGKF